MGEFGASAHGVFGIFIKRGQFDGVGPDAGETHDQKQRACREEAPEGGAPLKADPEEHIKRIDHDHQRQIVGDLLMVGLDLETQREAEQNRAEKGFRKPVPPAFTLGLP